MPNSISIVEIRPQPIKQCVLVDIEKRKKPKANPSLIPKKTKNSKRQSEISKKRQNFITGVSRTRMTHEEVLAVKAYNEEFVIRLSENSW